MNRGMVVITSQMGNAKCKINIKSKQWQKHNILAQKMMNDCFCCCCGGQIANWKVWFIWLFSAIYIIHIMYGLYLRNIDWKKENAWFKQKRSSAIRNENETKTKLIQASHQKQQCNRTSNYTATPTTQHNWFGKQNRWLTDWFDLSLVVWPSPTIPNRVISIGLVVIMQGKHN